MIFFFMEWLLPTLNFHYVGAKMAQLVKKDGCPNQWIRLESLYGHFSTFPLSRRAAGFRRVMHKQT